jgi:predicted small metal-binding protein
MKEFSCAEVVPDCAHSFQAESEAELLKMISAHAREDHGLDEVPPEVLDLIRARLAEQASADSARLA